MTRLKQLETYGQSIWLDYIRRSLLSGGGLDRLIREDRVKGVTSNPAIFEKAIAGSTDYAEAIRALADERDLDAQAIYEHLALDDIRQAADQLREVYEATDGRDGYVSIEVSPRLAHDTAATIQEARRLWLSIGRPNLMIKVPATPEGLPAIEALLVEGINVNVTLLFSTQVYEQVAETYLCALERRAEAHGDLRRIASVASFFVSRIDTAVDNLLAERKAETQDPEDHALLRNIEGQVAIANAKLAYQGYKGLFSGERWQALAEHGAQTQRLLWASTGVKNPAYSDVRYIEGLLGPDTVNTVPPATLDAFRDHGHPHAALEEDLESALAVMDTLERLGISLEKITGRLLSDGLRLFVEAFDKLLGAVETARATAAGGSVDAHYYTLPQNLAQGVENALEDWHSQDKVRRLWARDPWLWTGNDEAKWLDWLEIIQEQLDHLGDLRKVFHAVEGRYFRHLVLLGMGGSSLAPDVFRNTFGRLADHPELHVLDSTDPAQVKAIEQRIDLEHTVFVVSSKSGSTLEPNILKDYFFAKASEALGHEYAANRFVAITDPGSALEHIAHAEGFRRVFYGKPRIGGRYSALSNFGMVPAAAMGIDVTRFLDLTLDMVEACAACVPAHDNPGVVLGAVLGVCGAQARDKLTLIASPGIASLGAWLEQLVAESTGKQGKGLIPVDGEALEAPEHYGEDRIFVYLRQDNAPDPQQDAAVQTLEQAGQPVVRITVNGLYHLGQEFFRWEIATAVAGAILGINPFDQPDVEASKVETRKLTSEYEETGTLPQEAPVLADGDIRLYTDERNVRALRQAIAGEGALADWLKAHLGRIASGDYFAVLGYLNRLEPAVHEQMQAIRQAVSERYGVATCLGFGPRFLHSTGQAYKGGPNTGVFLQITCEDAQDLPVPGHQYSFGVVKAAQARGDFAVLAKRGRRALRVHLGEDTVAGLKRLREVVEGVINDQF
jgi:transaldolase/glucose-6-phosphate isomerase